MSKAPFQEPPRESFIIRHMGLWLILGVISLSIGIVTYQTWPVLKDPQAAYDKLNSMSCEELANAIAKGSSSPSMIKHPLVSLMSDFYEQKGCGK